MQIIRLIDTFLKGGLVVKENDLEYFNQLGAWKNTAVPEEN